MIVMNLVLNSPDVAVPHPKHHNRENLKTMSNTIHPGKTAVGNGEAESDVGRCFALLGMHKMYAGRGNGALTANENAKYFTQRVAQQRY